MPQFLFMENVPQVHGTKNINDFNEWISFLDSLGYKSKWQDLNAKDYGVAQNRDRCFMISWLEKGFCYQFPQPIPLTKTMRDYLDEEVDEKYYLKSDKAEKLVETLVSTGALERERESIDLNDRKPKTINVSHAIQTMQRGISKFTGKEVGVCERQL